MIIVVFVQRKKNNLSGLDCEERIYISITIYLSICQSIEQWNEFITGPCVSLAISSSN